MKFLQNCHSPKYSSSRDEWNNRLSLSMNNKSTLLNLNPPLYFTCKLFSYSFVFFSFYLISLTFSSLVRIRYYIYFHWSWLEEFSRLFQAHKSLLPSSLFISPSPLSWKLSRIYENVKKVNFFWIFYFISFIFVYSLLSSSRKVSKKVSRSYAHHSDDFLLSLSMLLIYLHTYFISLHFQKTHFNTHSMPSFSLPSRRLQDLRYSPLLWHWSIYLSLKGNSSQYDVDGLMLLLRFLPFV